MDVKEKAVESLEYVEKGPISKPKPGLSEDDREWLAQIDTKEQNRIYHKVDRRLVPMLALLYLIAHLDRANIANAKIEGLEASLGMTGEDYNIALVVFFIPYVLCEVPSNLLLSKFSRPSVYIGILVTCWGIIMTMSGVTQSFAGLLVTRFLIGVFEVGDVALYQREYPIVPGNNSWTINNLAGAEKRAAGIAFMIMIGNCGGFAGSFIFLERESPRYPTGFGSSLGFATAGIVAALLLEFLYWSHNKRHEHLTEQEAIAQYGEEELERMGNKSPLFKYSL